MEENEKKGGYLTWWYMVVAVMGVITVLSWVLYSGIYGEGSVFNSAPTGVQGLDAAWQHIPDVIDSIRIIFIVYILGKVAQLVLTKALSKTNKGITAAKLINSFIKYIVAIVAILAILSAWGVDTTTLVASAGILSLVVGLGAQSLIADIIAGLFTVFEDEYHVGDIVVVDGWRGTIEEIGIRTTKIVDAGGNVKIVNNSEITTVINQTKNLSLVMSTISISYEESLPRVELIIRDNLDRIRENIPEIVEGPFYKGVTCLNDSWIDLLFMANCKEEDYFPTTRALNRELKLLFDEHGIKKPYMHVVISDPEDPGDGEYRHDDEVRSFIKEQQEASVHLDNDNR